MAVLKIKVCDDCGDPSKKGLQVRRVGDQKKLVRLLLCTDCRREIDRLRALLNPTRTPVLTMDEVTARVAERRSSVRTPAQRKADPQRGKRNVAAEAS